MPSSGSIICSQNSDKHIYWLDARGGDKGEWTHEQRGPEGSRAQELLFPRTWGAPPSQHMNVLPDWEAL